MLTIKSLSYYYKPNKNILWNINTTLKPGNIYGLLGLNGEGKTTLLKLIVGMLLPKDGTIEFNGNLSSERNAAYLNEVYFLPDYSKLPDLGIEQFGTLYGAFYSKYNHQQYLDCIKEFNIPTNSRIRSLSLGQHRKVHISFAFACNSSVLLMDEPTNGLDIPSKAIFRKLLSRYINEESIFLIATHQIRDVDMLFDHLLIMKNGSIVLDENIHTLSQQFRISKNSADAGQAVYVQDDIVGQFYLVRNNQESESKLDIEFLFNAFTNNPNPIEL
ncbi:MULTISPECIES: ATP-binding cassette domain-containing protein [Sphingobacterium]|uniref:ABC transporter ATP-binding protein n=1 Tax=Sphingobacterium cellulitidis TaxID=1768011 RepID=A0A8H9FWM0_9SPHI|nr:MULTISPECIES: ABC transporter ATP-binding protein [Sphingobacterium]MBA8985729.1 ABC-2 type transport system ATP-binding protein [Sphingobacterium soli]WFB64141.1 ABC transporter ATP-binding protein [Sphingobacterium sp. WM]GGE07393.1 ABC transporter ATP-binding protein [Sphingobacterium soli]